VLDANDLLTLKSRKYSPSFRLKKSLVESRKQPYKKSSFSQSKIFTWNTVSRATGNLLKFVAGVSFSKFHLLNINIGYKWKLNATFLFRSWTYSPPNSCMPSSANIKINKKSRNRSEIIDRILFSRESTKFLSDDQYLTN
jgi:hypothetical protein